MDVGENIRRLRESRGMSQEELSEKIGVTRGAVGQWERGNVNPRMGAVERIAKLFDVRVSDIIDGVIDITGRPASMGSDDESKSELRSVLEKRARVAEVMELFAKLDDVEQRALLTVLKAMQR